MKKTKNHYDYDDHEYDEDVEKPHKKDDKRRRPVRNWKKVWDAHSTDYDEVDDFHR